MGINSFLQSSGCQFKRLKEEYEHKRENGDYDIDSQFERHEENYWTWTTSRGMVNFIFYIEDYKDI
jgi:hypothetical protein